MFMIFLSFDLRKSGRNAVVTVFVPLTLTLNISLRSVLMSDEPLVRIWLRQHLLVFCPIRCVCSDTRIVDKDIKAFSTQICIDFSNSLLDALYICGVDM